MIQLMCKSVFAAALLCLSASAEAQQERIAPDLFALAERQELHVINRTAAPLTDGNRKGARLSAGAGEGPALLPGVEFANGVIEFDVRGKDMQGQSFVGVAFHAVDGTTYDAVYFRPFNFQTTDAARRARAVQYISEPAYPWDKLRADHPGKYEQAVSPIPDPNDWFHVRIVVEAAMVRVFVGDATQPTLVVNQLSNRTKGRVGIWVGNGSGGDFANLKIVSR